MPDAGLFSDDTAGFQCIKSGDWLVNYSPSGYDRIYYLKMPKLTPEQLANDNLSITLKELKEYQSES